MTFSIFFKLFIKNLSYILLIYTLIIVFSNNFDKIITNLMNINKVIFIILCVLIKVWIDFKKMKK